MERTLLMIVVLLLVQAVSVAAEEWVVFSQGSKEAYLDRDSIRHGAKTSTATVKTHQAGNRTVVAVHEFDSLGRFRILQMKVFQNGALVSKSSTPSEWIKSPTPSLGNEVVKYITRDYRKKSAASSQNHTYRSSSSDWSDRGNWRKLYSGMSQSEVKQLLGEPLRVEKMGFMTFWHFTQMGVLGPHVTFSNGRLDGWSEP